MTTQSLFIVDDDLAVLKSLTEVLEELKLELFTSSDPFQALEAIKVTAPSVVITDLKMPGMDGMALLKRIREFSPGTQVIVITGHGSIEDAVAAMRQGAYDFISKPFRLAQIEATVQRALEKAALLEENQQLRRKLKKTAVASFWTPPGWPPKATRRS
jgi:DNA-binding NtrC family response regulator